MSQSLSLVYTHIVFSTKHRIPFIDGNIEESLFAYMGGICNRMECHPVRIGGYRNHVHILCRLSKNVTQKKLLQDVKRISSKWVKTQGDQYRTFKWQTGYSIFSVNPRSLDRVTQYIKNQKQHHQNETFQNELRRLLIKNDMLFDERYLWD